MADGIHSIGDLSIDVIALLGIKISLKNKKNNKKIEYFTSLIIGLMILITGLTVIYQMIKTQVSKPNLIVVWASVFVLVLKAGLACYLLKKGKTYKNNIIVASGKESLSDVYKAVLVLFPALLISINDYFIYSDKIASIIIGILILKLGFDIIKENSVDISKNK